MSEVQAFLERMRAKSLTSLAQVGVGGNAPPRISIDEDVLRLCSLMSQRVGLSIDRYITEALRRDFSRMQCLAAELPLASLMSRDMIARMGEEAKRQGEEQQQKEDADRDRDEALSPEEHAARKRAAAEGTDVQQ